MKKNIVFLVILFTLFFGPLSQVYAQSSDSDSSLVFFDTTGLPQWVKDMRRFDIVMFGVFPFSMFLSNIFYGLYRWNNANGMDFSSEGRRYAPWPISSSNAVNKNGAEWRTTFLYAAGLSISVAITDLILHKRKQRFERLREESRPPSGTYTIERTPITLDIVDEEPVIIGKTEDEPPGIDIDDSLVVDSDELLFDQFEQTEIPLE